MRFHILFIFVSLFLLTLSSALKADILHLKNGNEIEGEVAQETESTVTLRFEGGTIDFSRAEIERIEKKEPSGAPAESTSRKEPVDKDRQIPMSQQMQPVLRAIEVAMREEGDATRDTASYVLTALYYLLLMFVVKFTVKKMGSDISLIMALLFPVITYFIFSASGFIIGAGIPALVMLIGTATEMPLSVSAASLLALFCTAAGLWVGARIYLSFSSRALHLTAPKALLLLSIVVITHFTGLFLIHFDKLLKLSRILGRMASPGA